ncbi:hypothetical protein [Deinococcus altitudinis]|uniref:hypothetical protein n=1 Tax=Deinococcus altitudinis TaxID=468914 RepID=UPI0038919626
MSRTVGRVQLMDAFKLGALPTPSTWPTREEKAGRSFLDLRGADDAAGTLDSAKEAETQ